ncbi:MAG: cob(I)yrinic acid a,c-diamide adenosyltransferase [Microgenomates group bacterium]
MPVYTRTGDDGTTALFGGKRVVKCDSLVEVYGSIDEVNSWIGLLINTSHIGKNKHLLVCVQHDLFLIGSTLAGWKGDVSSLNHRVREMEKRIDEIETKLPPLSHFVLPGGTKESATVHIVRSITRRVERQMVAYSRSKKMNGTVSKEHMSLMVMYVNRLSDLLFIIARGINKTVGVPDVVWSGHEYKE